MPYVKIGDGPRKMIVVAQQHGDEAISNNGMISLIRALSSGAKEVKFIRDELTLYIVPKQNRSERILEELELTGSGRCLRK